MRQIGYVLRSCAEEMIVTSQELRWRACQTRMQARVEWARPQQVRSRTRKTAGEATYRVIVDGLSDYGVEVRCPGQFQSVRGFRTYSDALLWIADQKAAARQTEHLP